MCCFQWEDKTQSCTIHIGLRFGPRYIYNFRRQRRRFGTCLCLDRTGTHLCTPGRSTQSRNDRSYRPPKRRKKGCRSTCRLRFRLLHHHRCRGCCTVCKHPQGRSSCSWTRKNWQRTLSKSRPEPHRLPRNQVYSSKSIDTHTAGCRCMCHGCSPGTR
jgi:hypothetical protein